jgi:hypothetical protein
MVDRSYLLDKPAPPTPARRWFDQRAMPVAIDAAGSMERALEDVAQATRRQPASVLAIAAAVGFLAATLLPRS